MLPVDDLVASWLIELADAGFLDIAVHPVEGPRTLEGWRAEGLHDQDAFAGRAKTVLEVTHHCRADALSAAVVEDADCQQVPRPAGHALGFAEPEADEAVAGEGDEPQVVAGPVEIPDHHVFEHLGWEQFGVLRHGLYGGDVLPLGGTDRQFNGHGMWSFRLFGKKPAGH